MKNITAIIAAAVMMLCSCEKECSLVHQDQVLGYPSVKKGTFPTEDMTVSVGETISIHPELEKPENDTFRWYLDKELISEEQNLDYTFGNIYDGQLKCVIANSKGSVTLKVNIKTDHDFSKGYFIVLENDISFYDQVKKKRYDHILPALNGGQEFIMDEYTDICGINIEDGIFSVCLKHNASNVEHLHIFEYPSLKHRTSSIVSTSITCMIPIGNSYALMPDMYGIYRTDLMSGNPVLVSSPESTVAGSTFGSAAVHNGRIFFNTFDTDGSRVIYSDTETFANAEAESIGDGAYHTLDIVQKNKSCFVISGSNVYTRDDSSEKSAIAVIAEDLSIKKYDTGITAATGQYWSSPVVNMAAENDGSILIQAEDGSIYRHSGQETGIVVPSETYTELKNQISGGVYTLSDGSIAVTYGVSDWGDCHGGVAVFSPDGEKLYSTDFEDSLPTMVINGK